MLTLSKEYDVGNRHKESVLVFSFIKINYDGSISILDIIVFIIIRVADYDKAF